MPSHSASQTFFPWPRQRVAAQMINRSGYYAPDYVLNVGGRGYDPGMTQCDLFKYL